MPHVKFVSYFYDHERLMCWCEKLSIHNLECHATVPWHTVMKESSRCSAFLSMDSRVTIGRFCLDAAAMNVPCVGAFSESQAYLFPEFMVNPLDIDGTVNKLTEALTHQGHYPISEEKRHFYSLERFGPKFLELCEKMVN